MPYYIEGTESAVDIIWTMALAERGSVRWKATQDGTLVNSQGQCIGSLHRSVHGGWSIWTEPYAGFAYREEVEIVPCPQGNNCEFAESHYPISKTGGLNATPEGG